MNKLVLLFALLVATVVYIFNKDKLLTENFTLTNKIKAQYVEYAFEIKEFLNKYLNQAQTIEELKENSKNLVKFQSLYTSQKNDNKNIIKDLKSIPQYEENVVVAKVLSYVNLSDFTTIWLDRKKEDNSIEGLIDGEFSAGIVVNKFGNSQALLNGNEKSNYSVFVGKNKAPGITHKHTNNKFIIIKYIPVWLDIDIGDEVITSGMDNIFFEGLKVGKVVGIQKSGDTQEAVVSPYSKVLQKKYFYIYSKSKIDPQTKQDDSVLAETQPKLEIPKELANQNL